MCSGRRERKWICLLRTQRFAAFKGQVGFKCTRAVDMSSRGVQFARTPHSADLAMIVLTVMRVVAAGGAHSIGTARR
jgi:hypothetical protein